MDARTADRPLRDDPGHWHPWQGGARSARAPALRSPLTAHTRCAQNDPLYLKTFGAAAASSTDPVADAVGPTNLPEDELRFHFIVHAALDHIEERDATQRQWAGASSSGGKLEMYQGMLYPIDGMRVYGYLTNTRLKLVAVLDDADEVKDAEMKALFRRVHSLYADTVSNPFHTPDTEVGGCASFRRQIERIVDAGLFSPGAGSSAR